MRSMRRAGVVAVPACPGWAGPAVAGPVPPSPPQGAVPPFSGGPAPSPPISFADAPTPGHLFVIAQAAGPSFALQEDFDLPAQVPSSDKLVAAMPDWAGRVWFVSRNGIVGTVNLATRAVKVLDTHEPIGNSFAVDET